MGLLTREDEIVIAKRIQEGLKHMIQAISSCPTTIAEILVLADKVTREELRIDEIVDGFIEPEDETIIAVEEPSDEAIEVEDEEEEDVEDSEEDAEAVAAANLAKLKIDALERFAIIRELFIKIGKLMRSMVTEAYNTTSCRSRLPMSSRNSVFLPAGRCTLRHYAPFGGRSARPSAHYSGAMRY